MSSWTTDDLRAIGEDDDLYISPLREDGITYGTPTRIWSVVVGDDLYVRAANGPASRWYLAAMSQKAGRIRAGGIEYEVSFEPASDDTADAVDLAYADKYKGSSAVAVMQGPGPRSAAVRISPR